MEIRITSSITVLFVCQILTLTHAFYTTTTSKYGYNEDNECTNIPNPPAKWTETNIPNPQADTCECGRNGKASFVCDPNQLLSTYYADDIDDAITKLRRTTGSCRCGSKCNYVSTDYGGFQAAVVILDALYVKAGEGKLETAEETAEYLRDKAWEFGACNDDLVILISDQDRVVFTATGETMRETVSDKCVDDITANNKRYLSSKEYGKALLGMIEEYNEALNHEHPCNKPSKASWISIIVLGVLGAIGGAACCLCRRMGWCQNCNSGGGSGGNYEHAGIRRDSHHSHHSHHSDKSSASSGGGGDTF